MVGIQNITDAMLIVSAHLEMMSISCFVKKIYLCAFVKTESIPRIHFDCINNITTIKTLLEACCLEVTTNRTKVHFGDVFCLSEELFRLKALLFQINFLLIY